MRDSNEIWYWLIDYAGGGDMEFGDMDFSVSTTSLKSTIEIIDCNFFKSLTDNLIDDAET